MKRFTADEIGPVDGVVYFANAHTIGLRTEHALYRFMRGFGKPAVIGQVASLFEMVDCFGGFRRNGNFRGRLRRLGCRRRRGTCEQGKDGERDEQSLHKNLLCLP